VGFFTFWGLAVTLLGLPALFLISQYPAQVTTIYLASITAPANIKINTAKLAGQAF
jgi:hypothetical protein